jgi:hypothetical protein
MIECPTPTPRSALVAELRALLRVTEDGGMHATTEVTETSDTGADGEQVRSKDREKNPK